MSITEHRRAAASAVWSGASVPSDQLRSTVNQLNGRVGLSKGGFQEGAPRHVTSEDRSHPTSQSKWR